MLNNFNFFIIIYIFIIKNLKYNFNIKKKKVNKLNTIKN